MRYMVPLECFNLKYPTGTGHAFRDFISCEEITVDLSTLRNSLLLFSKTLISKGIRKIEYQLQHNSANHIIPIGHGRPPAPNNFDPKIEARASAVPKIVIMPSIKK